MLFGRISTKFWTISIIEQNELYQLLSVLYYSQDNFQKSLEYFKLSTQIRDSLQNLNIEQSLRTLELTRKSEQQIQQILSSEEEKRSQQIIRNILIVGILLISILCVIAFINYRQKAHSERIIRDRNIEIEQHQQLLEHQAQEIQLKNTALQEQLETLRRTQTQLAQAEKMASLGTLVAGVAHELNTPIGVAVTAASTLHGKVEKFENEYKEGGLKKSTLESFMENAKIGADLTLRNLERAANLIQSFKQVAVDQTSDSKRVINLKHYLEGVITSLEPKWKTTSHRVEIECDERIELETYPGAIAQIITNFITNSLMHGFEGFTEEGVMKIEVEREGSNIIMKYSDNGRGIPPEVLPRIFDPFFTTKQAQGGTGLGMHIVYNLVTQKLAGTILVENQVGGGVRFIIQIPSSKF
jgi:signal transduction histidine kinase